MMSMYFVLWTSLVYIATEAYDVLRFISKTSYLAKKLMVSVEKTITALRASSSSTPWSPRIQTFVEKVGLQELVSLW